MSSPPLGQLRWLSSVTALHGSLRMKNVNLFQIVFQVFPLVGAENAQGQANQCPEVHNAIAATVMFAQFMDLGMAVVAPGDTVVSTGDLNLTVL